LKISNPNANHGAGIFTIIYLQNWVIYGVNVGVHIPAPWFAYGEMKECQTPQAFLIGGSSQESAYGMGYNVGFPPKVKRVG